MSLCGTCTACCRVFAVPEVKPRPFEWCPHCAVGRGCTIYADRPQTCREYECLWLQSHGRKLPLPDGLRPDRCKVVFAPTTNPEIMAAITMPHAPDAWQRPVVRALIAAIVTADMAVCVGPPGSTRRIMIDKSGEHDVKMTEPDETGMQWSIK